jgi:hypothetical protein
MPFMPDGVFSALPVQQLDQFDIDRSLRALEFKHLNIDPNTSTRDWLDLSCCQRPYDVVIAMIPTPWPRDRPGRRVVLLRRLCALAQVREESAHLTDIRRSWPKRHEHPIRNDPQPNGQLTASSFNRSISMA